MNNFRRIIKPQLTVVKTETLITSGTIYNVSFYNNPCTISGEWSGNYINKVKCTGVIYWDVYTTYSDGSRVKTSTSSVTGSSSDTLQYHTGTYTYSSSGRTQCRMNDDTSSFIYYLNNYNSGSTYGHGYFRLRFDGFYADHAAGTFTVPGNIYLYATGNTASGNTLLYAYPITVTINKPNADNADNCTITLS